MQRGQTIELNTADQEILSKFRAIAEKQFVVPVDELEPFLQRLMAEKIHQDDVLKYIHAYQIFSEGTDNLFSECQEYVGTLNQLRRNFLVLIDEEIASSKKEEEAKKAALLAFRKEIEEGANSLIELLNAANAMLVDKNIIATKQGFSFTKNETAEEKISSFVNLLSEQFAQTHLLGNLKEVKRNIDIGRFTDQTQLTNVLNAYLDLYKEKFKGTVLEPISDRIMVKTDKAMVTFDPATTLQEKSEEDRINKNSLGTRTLGQVRDCLAYFLALNMQPEELPKQLQICFFVNHGAHWTALIANVEGFLPLYKQLYEIFKSERENIMRDNPDHRVLFGRTVEAMRHAFLEKLMPADFWQSKGVPKIQLGKDESFETLLALVKQNNIKINFDHYDSLHAGVYFDHAKDSLKNLTTSLGTTCKDQPCSKQDGNTCGDNTVCNSVSVTLFDTTPVIQSVRLPADQVVTSDTLRILTEHSQIQAEIDPEVQAFLEEERAMRLAQGLPTVEDEENRILVRPKPYDQNVVDKTVNDIVEQAILSQSRKPNACLRDPSMENLQSLVTLYTQRIYLLAKIDPAPLFAAIRKGSEKDVEAELEKHKSAMKSSVAASVLFNKSSHPGFDELMNKVLTLAAITKMSSNHLTEPLFNDLGIGHKDFVPYCNAAKEVYKDKQVNLETHWLSKKYSMANQERALDFYTKP